MQPIGPHEQMQQQSQSLGCSLHHLLQVAVLVLAALGKFTLWGAVLVDVGTSLLVILHGMLLTRWHLPGAKRSTTYSIKGQADGCSSKPCCSGKTAAEPHDHSAATSVTGKSPCCSSSKQCSGTVVAELNEDYAANILTGKPPCCSRSKEGLPGRSKGTCCTGKAASDP